MKVSIIIPTHKRGDLLKYTLDSVVNQSYKNMEIVVVSDGFDRDTDLFMKSYNNHKVKYYVYQESKGANFARNFGVSKSSGEILAFVDDDDRWSSSKINQQVQFLRNNPRSGLVYTGNKQIYMDSGDSFEYRPNEMGDLSKKIFEKNYIGSTSSVIVKRSVFEEAGGFDENLEALQDYDLWIRITQISEIGVVSEPLLFYYNDRSRVQISGNLEKYINSAKIMKGKYKKLFLENDNLGKVFDRFINQVLLKKAMRNNNNKRAREIGKILITRYPSFSSFTYYLSTFLSYDMLLKARSLFNKT